jgi:GGDEF domain-containing protein
MRIDHFDFFVTTHGRKVAESVAKEVRRIIKNNLLPHIFFARWRADSFLIVAEHVEGKEAYKWAESIRKAVRTYPFYTMWKHLDNVTITAAVANFPKNAGSLPLLFERLQGALGKVSSDTVVQV